MNALPNTAKGGARARSPESCGMGLTLQTEAAARRFRELLAERFGSRLCEVRVFGSRARGDFHEESDLDLFVMVDDDETALLRRTVAVATEVMREQELPFALTPLVMTREHFESLRSRELRLAHDILAEGVPV